MGLKPTPAPPAEPAGRPLTVPTSRSRCPAPAVIVRPRVPPPSVFLGDYFTASLLFPDLQRPVPAPPQSVVPRPLSSSCPLCADRHLPSFAPWPSSGLPAWPTSHLLRPPCLRRSSTRSASVLSHVHSFSLRPVCRTHSCTVLPALEDDSGPHLPFQPVPPPATPSRQNLSKGPVAVLLVLSLDPAPIGISVQPY